MDMKESLESPTGELKTDQTQYIEEARKALSLGPDFADEDVLSVVELEICEFNGQYV